ncbi:TldD/PmbA family protein [Candidatus Fermentibacteria bacterium]|nr:TldD/PmbA family protein [Candidatus Fermentibacteria bacterium]
MDKLLEISESRGCRAEVFGIRTKSTEMEKTNGSVNAVSASIQSGVSLRVIKNGKTGMAYTKNLINREELVDNALASLEAGVEAGFDFPESGALEFTEEYDDTIEGMGFPELREQIEELEALYGGVTRGIVSLRAGCGTTEITIRNTSGANLMQKDSEVYRMGLVMYPGSSTDIGNVFRGRSKAVIHEPDVKRTLGFFRDSLPEIKIGEGRMKVLVLPDVLYAFTWRLGSAASAKAFHEKISPLMNKKGQQVISSLLSLISDPTTAHADRRLFDDEGVQTRRVPIFENGVFTSAYNNLDYAAKLSEKPLGTGFRGGMWGGDKISLSPSPSLSYANFQPGAKSFEEMLSMIDRGVIVHGLLGAHSGNILNGDLSVGLNPGLYVENGEIVGRVKDGMMAGNVYDMLSKAVAVESGLHYTGSVFQDPSILLNDISVVGA